MNDRESTSALLTAEKTENTLQYIRLLHLFTFQQDNDPKYTFNVEVSSGEVSSCLKITTQPKTET